MSAIRIIIASALITGAALKAVPALAAPLAEANVSIVRTVDLDLTTDAGRRALDHRLVTAAYDVCGSTSDVDLAGKNKARACRVDVLAKARAESQQLASRNGNGTITLAAR